MFTPITSTYLFSKLYLNLLWNFLINLDISSDATTGTALYSYTGVVIISPESVSLTVSPIFSLNIVNWIKGILDLLKVCQIDVVALYS